MTKFNITLTMDDGQYLHSDTLSLNEQDLLHIFLTKSEYSSLYRMSDSDINEVLSIINSGILNYANVNNKVKYCTIVTDIQNMHGTTTTIKYDFNTGMYDNVSKIDMIDCIISLHNYILTAAIEYQFNQIKKDIFHDFTRLKDCDKLNMCCKLYSITRPIIARLDMSYYNKDDKFNLFFDEFDILRLKLFSEDFIRKYVFPFAGLNEDLDIMLSYYKGGYKPYFDNYDDAYEAFIKYFTDMCDKHD